MNEKALLAKHWKNKELNLSKGQHRIDRNFVVRIRGTVVKHSDQMIAPTVSIPLVTTLALFWEKAGINQDVAPDLLREAITEAMDDGVDDNHVIQQRIEQVETAIKAVKNDLIAQLPKIPRMGKVVTDDLTVELVPVQDDALVVA
ncbi:hypothetical protein GC197_14490 [bacterium]|nr:hypothetical protein [bacterium]